MPRIRQQFNSSKEIEAYYQNPNVSRAYEKIRFSSLLGGMVDQSEWQLVPEILKKNKCKKIIELASGTGRITRAMQEFSGIAVDSSPAMLEEAKQSLPTTTWKFEVGNVFEYAPKKNPDAVVSFRLFRHLNPADQERFLRQANTMLGKNGLLIMDAINAERSLTGRLLEKAFSLGKIIKGIMLQRPAEGVYDYYHTLRELKEILSANGFELVENHPVVRAYGKVFMRHCWQKLTGQRSEHAEIMRALEKDKHQNGKAALQWVVVARKREEMK